MCIHACTYVYARIFASIYACTHAYKQIRTKGMLTYTHASVCARVCLGVYSGRACLRVYPYTQAYIHIRIRIDTGMNTHARMWVDSEISALITWPLTHREKPHRQGKESWDPSEPSTKDSPFDPTQQLHGVPTEGTKKIGTCVRVGSTPIPR